MSSRQWYAAIGGKQEGPFPDERLRELIASGMVRADTLVWCEGMTNWAKAGDVPGLIPTSRIPPQPPRDMAMRAPAAPAGAVSSTGPLEAKIGVWAFFGRTLLIVLANIVVIPMPWVMTSFYQWFVEHTTLPGQQRVTFAGKPGDIWYIFMLQALCGYAGLINHYLNLAVLPLSTLFLVIIMRWVVRNLVWDGQTNALSFTGGYWPMLGWYLLTILSIISIIGWAWVATAWMRWVCRHVEGSVRQLAYIGSGWGMLWRSMLFFLSCIPIIPIPWTLHWYVRWIVSQFALTERAQAAA